jgi:hypothetical protein
VHYDNDPSEPVQVGPAVTAAAMNASLGPPEYGPGAGRKPAHNPAFRPDAATNDLLTASGELTPPDLAEVPPRAAASTTAAHFDVDLRPDPTQQDKNTNTANPCARKVTGEQITTAHRLALAAETLGHVDQIDRT